MDVIIAGAGTAGQIAALTISRVRPDINVTVVASSDIGTISAGEGSTYLFTRFLSGAWFDTGIDINDFYKQTNATYKVGIKHVGWREDGGSYFAPLGGSSTYEVIPDTEFLEVLSYTNKRFHVASIGGRAYELDTVSDSHSYHFDSSKIVEYISSVAKDSGVRYVDAAIQDVDVCGGRVESITIDNGDIMQADFFVDASGFNRVLMNSLDNSWVSYRKHLPVDSAISFTLDHNGNFEPLTTATAMDNGWVWKIPTLERFGCGYVYSSAFTDQRSALREIKSTHGDVDITNTYSFDSGRLESPWVSNCLAVGLASSFVEPLEATSIHTAIVQIAMFVFNNLRQSDNTVERHSIDKYNSYMNKMYDDIRDFLIVHYKGGRGDSEFWRYMNSDSCNTQQVNRILNISKNGVPTLYDIDNYLGAPGIMLWNWVLAGTGNTNSSVAKKEIENFKNVIATGL
jgi:tryptophan halogenase